MLKLMNLHRVSRSVGDGLILSDLASASTHRARPCGQPTQDLVGDVSARATVDLKLLVAHLHLVPIPIAIPIAISIAISMGPASGLAALTRPTHVPGISLPSLMPVQTAGKARRNRVFRYPVSGIAGWIG